MSIIMKKMNNGRVSKHWHYRFMIHGKLYTGSTYTSNIHEAGRYEEKKKLAIRELARDSELSMEELRDLINAKNPLDLVNKRMEQLQKTRSVPISDSWNLYIKKIKSSSRQLPKEGHLKCLKSRWDDFCSFLTVEHPDCKYLHNITNIEAEEYVLHLRENGKYSKTVTQGKKSYKSKIKSFSNRTINGYQSSCSQILKKIRKYAGLMSNPFEDIEYLPNNHVDREIFTDDELKLISESEDEFVKPLFIFALYTGYRLEDICLLKWSEIDMKDGFIIHKLHKTGKTPAIPIFVTFIQYLTDLFHKTGNCEYVLPGHAEMYKTNRTGISYRIKKFLQDLGIKTNIKVEGRDREISVKDIHSMRHQFVTVAMLNNVPFNLIKDIVGHVSEKMTEKYMNHVNRAAKKEFMVEMPNYFALPQIQVVV